MNDDYKPTCFLRWFRTEDGRGNGLEPRAKIDGNEWNMPEWFVLRQKWVSAVRGEPDEWRDIEVVP